MKPGESVFTIGSCFARNVETELLRRNFKLPMRELFLEPAFKNLEVGIINNYGTPSIYNELAWAFGAEPFDPKQHIVEAMPGKFADLHLSPSMRPDSWDAVLERRQGALAATRKAAECRIVIMTLGLVEVWFDTKTGYYCNVQPRPSLMRSEPDRFRLHVLSFEETYGYLEKAIMLLRKHGLEDMQVLLTVSPVPLTVTHRPIDVIVANTYSKSVLRAAAETIVARYSFVSYFPSYESIVHSDRKIAFLDDLRHVSSEMVSLNVGRMVRAFAGDDFSTWDKVKEQIAAGGLPVALDTARTIQKDSPEAAPAFFKEFAHWSKTSVEFALEHARCLATEGQFDDALTVLEPHESTGQDRPAIALGSEILLKAGRAQEAMDKLKNVPDLGVKSKTIWINMLSAAIALGDPDIVISVLARLQRNVKTYGPASSFRVARFFRDRGDAARAIDFYRTAAERNDSMVATLELAELLVTTGRLDEARAVLKRVAPTTPREARTIERLSVLAGLQVPAE